MSTGPFRLYPEEQPWWSFNDYGAVLDIVVELKARKAIEFGPGSSTLALIEGGCLKIDTCEDDPEWAKTYMERLEARFPDIVTIHRYTWARKLKIGTITDRDYDVALIDGPKGLRLRGASFDFALPRSRAIILADLSSQLRAKLRDLEESGSHRVEYRHTGPLAGAFALAIRS